MQLSKNQKIRDIENVLSEIVRIRNERFSYHSGAHAYNNESSLESVQYKPTPDLQEQMAENEVVKEKKNEKLKTGWREHAQLLPSS